MKIAVIGAGIAGVTTAWELAQDGHEVTVFERRLAAAEEGSFANTGLISAYQTHTWLAPSMLAMAMRHLFTRHTPMRVTLPLTRSDLGWLWRSWRAPAQASYTQTRQCITALAEYSRSRLLETRDALELEFDQSPGLLVLLRQERDQLQAASVIQRLREFGVAAQELSAEQARVLEPALSPDTSFKGAIHLPNDAAANCRQFALLIKNAAQARGVQFVFSTEVEQIQTGGQGLDLKLKQNSQAQHFDAVVLCAGTEAASLLRPLGRRVPMATVYGYSVSAHIREPLDAPRSAVFDERYKVSIARLGQRVRVGGISELGGHTERHRKAALQTLYKVLHDWFPGSAVLSSGLQTWKGPRAMMPDDAPILGPSGHPGLWLNSGHGSSGWTLASGAARTLADQIAGRSPAVDISPLNLSRFQD
jgi:D-amino-acid dehydrogenase